MNFKWDKKYLYWGVTAFLVIAAAIVFFLGLSQIKEIVIVNLDRYPALGFTAHHFRKIRHGLGGGMILRHGFRQPQDYGLAPGKGRTLLTAA